MIVCDRPDACDASVRAKISAPSSRIPCGTWLVLEDGEVFSGILLRFSSTEVFRGAVGKERTFKKTDIVRRKELKTSLMPTDLAEQLTDGELRDLLAFLSAPSVK